MVLRIGLTGGIGSGKSTVATIFQSLNIPVVDADKIAHQLTAPNGGALSQIKAIFGTSVFQEDGTLSRDRLRQRVFNNIDCKKQLEAVLHPLIFNEAQRQCKEYAKSSPIIIFDIPLLAPGSIWLKHLDRILVIDCSEETQIARVMQRSGWDEAQIRQVIAQQVSREQRLKLATDVIINDGISMADLEKQIIELLKQWHNIAKAI